MEVGTGLLALGSQMADLVARVAKRHSRSPAGALQELRLLTNNNSASSIEEWFSDVSIRYADAKQHYFPSAEEKSALANVMEVAKSVLPQEPSSVDDLSDAFSAILNAVDFDTVTDVTAMSYAKAIASVPSAQRARWTTSSIVAAFVQGPLADSHLPARWWLEDTPNHVDVLRVALRAMPPTLLIEYVVSPSQTVRHRRVHLDSMFRETGSVVPLAKKVHQSVAFTGMSLEDLQRYLTRLQRLARGEDALTPMKSASTAASTAAHTASANGTAVPTKADIGLLYRDPKAALKNVDLQDADDMVVQEYKNKMDEEFLTRKLKPGDPGYQYDVRKEFNPSAKSEWDDDD